MRRDKREAANKKGKIIKKVKQEQIVETLKEEILKMI